MQGAAAIAPVMAAPQSLAINGRHLSLDQLAHRIHPVGEAGGEPLWVQHAEYPTEGIVRGNPVGQLQEPVKPFPFGLAELLDLHPVVRAADDGTQGDDDDVQQFVAFGPPISGVL